MEGIGAGTGNLVQRGRAGLGCKAELNPRQAPSRQTPDNTILQHNQMCHTSAAFSFWRQMEERSICSIGQLDLRQSGRNAGDPPQTLGTQFGGIPGILNSKGYPGDPG